jgi:hypothetical protein
MMLVCAGLFLAACTASRTEVPATEANPALAGVLPPDVALTIRNQVSELLGVPIESIQISQLEKMEWPNSCLGLPEAEQVCTEVITPGWLLTFSIDGQEYQFRADETGTVIRQDP